LKSITLERFTKVQQDQTIMSVFCIFWKGKKSTTLALFSAYVLEIYHWPVSPLYQSIQRQTPWRCFLCNLCIVGTKKDLLMKIRKKVCLLVQSCCVWRTGIVESFMITCVFVSKTMEFSLDSRNASAAAVWSSFWSLFNIFLHTSQLNCKNPFTSRHLPKKPPLFGNGYGPSSFRKRAWIWRVGHIWVSLKLQFQGPCWVFRLKRFENVFENEHTKRVSSSPQQQ